MSGWSGILRPKGHLGSGATAAVLTVALLPLGVAMSRIIARPGGETIPIPGLDLVRAFGAFLNQYVIFDWSPPDDRSTILFLLLLPTGVLLVALFRLTLGVRVLGLRAILLAMGFQAIGFLSTFFIMGAIVCTIVAVRPWLRRIRLPMYGRLAFIVCLAAIVMITAALAGPWLGSESVWRAAFFPAIIMAMIAEGIAKSIERDDLIVGCWRVGWTIVLALVITLLDETVLGLSYRFPEIVVTELMAIVLVAEFLDLRLLEAWPDRLARYLAGVRPWWDPRPRVALVRNRGPANVIASLGRPAPAHYQDHSVQHQVAALREQGFDVRVFEGDRTAIGELARYLPPDIRTNTPGGVVLNMASGVQGEGRFLQMPAVMEMVGLAYTGPDPLGHARLADRLALITLLSRAQVPVPRQLLVDDPNDIPSTKLPAVVRPRCEPDAQRQVVSSRRALRNAVRRIRMIHHQAAVVEQPVVGRKICAAIIGNDDPEILPLVEIVSGGRKVCPAEVDEAEGKSIRALARAAFRAIGCRDYARVDLRLAKTGEAVVVDVRCADVFARGGAFVLAADAAGYGLGGVLRRIVTEAAARYANAAAVAQREPADGPAVVSLAQMQVRTAIGGA